MDLKKKDMKIKKFSGKLKKFRFIQRKLISVPSLNNILHKEKSFEIKNNNKKNTKNEN